MQLAFHGRRVRCTPSVIMQLTTWFLVSAIGALTAAPAQAERRPLPPPQQEGGASLASTLATRHSLRSFGRRALDDKELGQLLWAGFVHAWRA